MWYGHDGGRLFLFQLCGLCLTFNVQTTTGTGGMIATEEGTAMDGAETATGSATQDKKTTDEEART